MAKDYTELVTTVLDNIGGPDNIISVAHCITRLRLKLKDPSIAMDNADIIGARPEVIQVMDANGQVHVVVGNIIEDVFDQFCALPGVPSGAGAVADDEDEGNKTLAAMAIDLVSGIFAPSLGVLSAAGIMKGLLALVAFFVPEFSSAGAYTVLYTIADGFFYFLPVVLGLNAARKFNMNEFVGLAIGFSLVYPNIVAAAAGETLGTISLGFLGDFSWSFTFFGIPVIMPASGYPSSVIPVILMVALADGVQETVETAQNYVTENGFEAVIQEMGKEPVGIGPCEDTVTLKMRLDFTDMKDEITAFYRQGEEWTPFLNRAHKVSFDLKHFVGVRPGLVCLST